MALDRTDWRLGGRTGRTLILSATTSEGFRNGGKAYKEVMADAAVIAAALRTAIDVQASDGAWLATAQPGTVTS